ncbi:MAG: helix-turn-helix transcriptional regulator [Tepidisphaeraceae bacterium]|jgi:predicted XRE-type DNA-binding protein
MKKKTSDETATADSGNVFSDLGFGPRQATELKVKAQLALRIHDRIKELGLIQTKAAAQLGVSQPDVSKLMNGRHTRFSVDKLMALLNALEVDIDIVVRPRHHGRTIRPGVMRVMEAVA